MRDAEIGQTMRGTGQRANVPCPAHRAARHLSFQSQAPPLPDLLVATPLSILRSALKIYIPEKMREVQLVNEDCLAARAK